MYYNPGMVASGLIDPKTLLRPTLKRMTKAQRFGFEANRVVRTQAMKLRAGSLELAARASGKRFKCAALSGESSYNIAINADLSVSCNCDDTTGEGRIGSMKTDSFEQVFRGPRATELRQSLADGTIPLSRCVQCPELQQVPHAQAQRWVTEYALPVDGVMFENNAGCNLSCVGCYRAFRPLERLKMRIGDVRRVARELAGLGVEQIAFFTLGEPFMSKNILEELEAIRQEHPDVRIYTSTNGTLLDSESKRMAALKMDVVWFSVDGSDQESLVKYQVGANFEVAYENMCKLVEVRDQLESRTAIHWKYIVFRWNDRRRHIERAVELARRARVDSIEFCFTKNPFHAISPRFHAAQHFRELGAIDSRGRRVVRFSDLGATN